MTGSTQVLSLSSPHNWVGSVGEPHFEQWCAVDGQDSLHLGHVIAFRVGFSSPSVANP